MNNFSVSSKLYDFYSMDLRSLALCRILLGRSLIIDVLFRLQGITAFYTDFGLMPRSVLIDKYSDNWLISVNLMKGSAEF